MPQKYTITVERILHPKGGAEAKGRTFVVMLAKVEEIRATRICKGTLFWIPKPGDRLFVTAETEVYQGTEQLKITSAEAYIPVDEKALLDYACELTDGVGESIARQLWEAYGAEWAQKVTSGEAVAKGLSVTRRAALVETIERLRREKEKTTAMTFMLSRGMTQNMAEAAWAEWALQAVHVLQDNPYRIAELPNYGFEKADAVAIAGFGIPHHDDRRKVAYALHVITNACDSDTYIPRQVLLGDIRRKFGAFVIHDLCALLCREGTGIVMTEESVTTERLYRGEMTIHNYLTGAAW